MDEQIKLLLRRDKIIYAVNLVRQEKGWGLRQAKEYIERIERGMKRKGTYRKIKQLSLDLESQARTLIRRGQEEQAVEFLRQNTVMRRKEAGEYVESLKLIGSIQQERRRGASRSSGVSQPIATQSKPNIEDRAELERQTRDILQKKGKVAAIKFIREAMPRLGLREGKDIVDGLQRGQSLDSLLDKKKKKSSKIVLPAEIEMQARELLAQGKKIHAVKLVYEKGGLGLRESKEYVESL